MNAEFIETAWHEVSVNLVFGDEGECCQHGLEPFYAAEAIVRERGGSRRARCRVGDYEISVKLYYQKSGIGALDHPSAGLDTIREFRIVWEVLEEDDDVGERSGAIRIAPRTPNMTDQKGEQISTPQDLTGVNCKLSGSNFPLGRYGELLHRATQALGFDSRYFAETRVHQQYSNVQDAAKYVRLIRGGSSPIHAVDGAIARVSNLLANDREGYRRHIADDTEAPGCRPRTNRRRPTLLLTVSPVPATDRPTMALPPPQRRPLRTIRPAAGRTGHRQPSNPLPPTILNRPPWGHPSGRPTETAPAWASRVQSRASAGSAICCVAASATRTRPPAIATRNPVNSGVQPGEGR